MRKTLEDLYYGNISPAEQQYIRNTDYDKAIRTVSEKEKRRNAENSMTFMLKGIN